MKTTKTPTMPMVFTTYDIGRMTGTDPTTVHKWIDRGLLRGYRTPGGHRRVRGEDLRSFLAAHKMPVPRELGGGGTLRFMLVDCDPESLKTVTKALKKLRPNWDVIGAPSCVEALLMVTTVEPQVIAYDVACQEVDGPMMCRHLLARPESAGVKLVGLLGRHSSADLERKALAAGVCACLRKPVDPAELVAAVEEALGFSVEAAV